MQQTPHLASRTMLISAGAMTAELEMIVDPAVGGANRCAWRAGLKRSRSRRRVG
jgi:hypothetical protein